jgi:hypothetical protein
MKKLYRLLVMVAEIVTVLIVVSGCSSTKLRVSWYDTESVGESFERPLVLALSDTQVIRTKLEDEFVRVLALNGIAGEQSYKAFPNLNENSNNEIKGRLAELGRDSVLVTHLVDVKKEQIHIPERTTIFQSAFIGSRYRRFSSYYAFNYDVVRSPGYSYEALTYILETNLYNARNEKLVWTARTETADGSSIDSAVKDFVQVITKNMMQDGFLHPNGQPR